MPRVRPAKPYQWGALGSFSRTQNMLIRQHKFPDAYDDRDLINDWDHDRIEDINQCSTHHTGSGPAGLGSWARKAKQAEVLAFLKDALDAGDTTIMKDADGNDIEVRWTGFRIMASKNVSNGQTVFNLALFAKHPDSKTKVYSGNQRAPNITDYEGVEEPPWEEV